MIEVVVGVAFSLITQLAKRYDVDVKIIMTLLALVGGLVYQGYVMFVDPTLQENVVEFIAKSVGISTVAYNSIMVLFNKINKNGDTI